MAEGQALMALDDWLGPSFELVLADGTSADETDAAWRAIHRRFVPNKVVARRRAERELIARQQAELAKQANITMQQAIQIATNQYPGTVLESRLVRESNQACYVLTILSDNGTVTTSTRVLISAIDGTVLKTMKEER